MSALGHYASRGIAPHGGLVRLLRGSYNRRRYNEPSYTPKMPATVGSTGKGPRSGVGLRLGANIGYLKFTPDATWNPF